MRRWTSKMTAVAFMALYLLMSPTSAPAGQDARPKACLDREMDAGAVLPDFEPVRAKIRDVLKETGVPSVSVALAKEGRIIWAESFGWADVMGKRAATPDTPYSLASISKPVTATGLMVLVGRKLIGLDDPVDKYLDGRTLTAHEPGGSPATVRTVLNHSAGLPLHYQFFYSDEQAVRPAMEETIRRYGIQVFARGTVYQYSNLGYGIIDDIISRVSGGPPRRTRGGSRSGSTRGSPAALRVG